MFIPKVSCYSGKSEHSACFFISVFVDTIHSRKICALESRIQLIAHCKTYEASYQMIRCSQASLKNDGLRSRLSSALFSNDHNEIHMLYCNP